MRSRVVVYSSRWDKLDLYDKLFTFFMESVRRNNLNLINKFKLLFIKFKLSLRNLKVYLIYWSRVLNSQGGIGVLLQLKVFIKRISMSFYQFLCENLEGFCNNFIYKHLLKSGSIKVYYVIKNIVKGIKQLWYDSLEDCYNFIKDCESKLVEELEYRREVMRERIRWVRYLLYKTYGIPYRSKTEVRLEVLANRARIFKLYNMERKILRENRYFDREALRLNKSREFLEESYENLFTRKHQPVFAALDHLIPFRLIVDYNEIKMARLMHDELTLGRTDFFLGRKRRKFSRVHGRPIRDRLASSYLFRVLKVDYSYFIVKQLFFVVSQNEKFMTKKMYKRILYVIRIFIRVLLREWATSTWIKKIRRFDRHAYGLREGRINKVIRDLRIEHTIGQRWYNIRYNSRWSQRINSWTEDKITRELEIFLKNYRIRKRVNRKYKGLVVKILSYSFKINFKSLFWRKPRAKFWRPGLYPPKMERKRKRRRRGRYKFYR